MPASRFTVVTSTKFIMISHLLPSTEPGPTIKIMNWVGWIHHLPWEHSFTVDFPSLFLGTKSHPRLGAHHRSEGMVARGEGFGYDGAAKGSWPSQRKPTPLPLPFILKGVGSNEGAASHLFHLTPIHSPASAVSRDSSWFFPSISLPPAQSPLFLSFTQKQFLYIWTISTQESHLATVISLGCCLDHYPVSPPRCFFPFL